MRILKAAIFLLLLLVIGFFFYTADISSLYSRFSQELTKGENFVKEVLTPPPLRGPEGRNETFLTTKGVIEWTNQRRKENGLSPLKEHFLLSAASEKKVQDMFEKQFFAHTSPSGKGAADLLEEEGYQFIAVGENLALGNYESDAALVQAWMDSPGHRENILKPNYEEIGVALFKGMFEGRTTWLAVQIFARPLSSCPEADFSLRQIIERNESILAQLQQTLDTLRREIKSERGQGQQQKVNEYNMLVKKYNDLAQTTKSIISTYNNQIKAFNECLQQ